MCIRDRSRLDLAQVNVNILKSITPEIIPYAPDATYVIVSNPVDILTYAFCKYSGLPEQRIIGSGTILDTARLRSRIAEYFKVNQQNVHAYVLGEHGDSSFIPWSIANISNVPVEDYRNSLLNAEGDFPELKKSEVEEYVKKSGARVIQRKGDVYKRQVVRVLNPTDYITALTTKSDIHDKQTYLPEYNKYVEETIIYDENYHIIMGIMRDITKEETVREKKEALSRQTIEITDKVIDKQMRVVQEIASLLGETTAETDVYKRQSLLSSFYQIEYDDSVSYI